MSDLYRVAEFAQLAGVTVRTLQYYDRIGLLQPAQTTEGGHRLYARRDLLRLQQVLTLKWMGFKLDEIKGLLDSPPYDLRTALRIQKAAIDGQLASLQAASAALAIALQSTELEAEMLASDRISAVIRAVTTGPDGHWAHEFYSDEAWAGISTRRLQYSAADLERWRQDWQELISQFAAVRHLAPESDAVQRLAAIMGSYLEQFTAGDPETAQGLARLRQSSRLPQAYRMADQELEHFMQIALAIYLERSST